LTSFDGLRARNQADMAGLVGHVGRLGWSAARLRGWPASGSIAQNVKSA
jgi:hypothetical protein